MHDPFRNYDQWKTAAPEDPWDEATPYRVTLELNILVLPSDELTPKEYLEKILSTIEDLVMRNTDHGTFYIEEVEDSNLEEL